MIEEGNQLCVLQNNSAHVQIWIVDVYQELCGSTKEHCGSCPTPAPRIDSNGHYHVRNVVAVNTRKMCCV